jgi:uncharacterized membrane protein YoaK (UPF0700 family)
MASISHDDRDGPLPALLLVLTFTTGVVDAASYLGLGHVFVANMTGNVVFLGFAAAGTREFSLVALLTAVAGFLCGAFAGGRLGSVIGRHRGHLLTTTLLLEFVLVGTALVCTVAASAGAGSLSGYGAVVLLAISMGLQNATTRHLGVSDVATTVLTSTLTALAAEGGTAKGARPRTRRRVLTTLAMLFGAAAGAIVLFQLGIGATLALASILLFANGAAAYRASRSKAQWTASSQ